MAPHQRPEANDSLLIRDFGPSDREAFRQLNEEWIGTYFKIEDADEKVLSNPANAIVEPGGAILLAELNGKVAGCCALVKIADREFEVAKMAVSPASQGSGIGRKLLQATIDKARRLGAKRLYLETNHQLAPAIHLYEALGFRNVPPEKVHVSPYARADVFMEMWLQ